MKYYLKILPVAAGLALATFGSINQVQASTSSEEDTAAFGWCDGGGDCGTTAQGTQLVGKWHEGPKGGQIAF